MDHLFHKNILQEKHNLEWQLAEANAKIEQLQRKLSSLQEKQNIRWNPPAPLWLRNFSEPKQGQPEWGPNGWYSPRPYDPEYDTGESQADEYQRQGGDGTFPVPGDGRDDGID